MKRLTLPILLLNFLLAATTSAQPGTDGRQLSWDQTETSLTLKNGEGMVWQHVHDRQVGKPFMRFGLLDGTELTRPWPFSKDYPKADHVWHRALWWSWKTIDGVNFWEQHQEGTEPVEVAVATADDFSAKITMTIHYHQPDQPPVVKEVRTVAVSAPDAAGGYQIDWTAVFSSATDQPVVFGQNSYGGLAIRLSADCCGNPGADRPAWVFRDDQGRENGTNNQQARWVAYDGKTPQGEAACVAIFDHPENPGHPAYWQLRNQYPYLNPSLTCKDSYQLEPGQQLSLQYRILVASEPFHADGMQQRWQGFAAAGQ